MKETETATATQHFDSHKVIIVKWIRVLLVCQIIVLCRKILGNVAFLGFPGSINTWISRMISVVMMISLFQMQAVNERYRKAALFYGISLVCGIAILLVDRVPVPLVLCSSVVSYIASFHEFNAHSEITAHKDVKLSKKWCSLFYLDLCVGLLAGLVGMIPIMIAAFAGADSDTISQISSICSTFVILFIDLLHAIYLNQTLQLYKRL